VNIIVAVFSTIYIIYILYIISHKCIFQKKEEKKKRINELEQVMKRKENETIARLLKDGRKAGTQAAKIAAFTSIGLAQENLQSLSNQLKTAQYQLNIAKGKKPKKI
jgi:tRNA A-37 threonylcarbamoyl transferase component Bud32